MRKFMKNARRRMQDERGITGLETAIILIAFVVVATVFAFIVLTTGIFSAERGKETVYAGLQKARGTIEVRGGVIATSSAPPAVDKIQFTVANTAGGDAVLTLSEMNKRPPAVLAQAVLLLLVVRAMNDTRRAALAVRRSVP